jgi:hypothetical protein
LAKGRLRVRRLTLPPNSNLGGSREDQDPHDDEVAAKLFHDRERLSRAIEILEAASVGRRRGDHKLAIEPNFISKFWADGSSSSDSKDEVSEEVARSESETDLSTPTLVTKAIAAGFSLDEIQQAGNELDSSSSSALKVCIELTQGSVVKRIIDVWVDSRKGKVKQWRGPLPVPH